MADSIEREDTETFNKIVKDCGLLDIYAYWRSLRRSPTTPSRKDFDPTRVKPFLPFIIIGEVIGARLRIRLAGTEIVRRSGFDPTGKFADEAYGRRDFGRLLGDACRQVIARKKPVSIAIRSDWDPREPRHHQHLLLPFFDGGEAVSQIMCVGAYPESRPRKTLKEIGADALASTLEAVGIAHHD